VPQRSQLVWVDRQGHEESLPIEPADFSDVAISPDGQRIAASLRNFATGSNVWIVDPVRQSMTQLATDPGFNGWPLWTPDGRALVYSSTRESQEGRDIFRRAADGTGPIERLTKTTLQQSPWSWSRDGKALLLQQFRPGSPGFAVSTASQDGETTVIVPAPSGQPAVSPDGRWLAYHSAESGRFEIWVRPFPSVTSARWLISTDGGREPKWAPGGRELFYRRGSSVMRVSIETEPGFRAGRPERLFEANYEVSTGEKAWDVAPNGRLLMKKPLRSEYSVNIVLNWQEELKQRVPTR